ncbi:uncharacterized protein LOC110853430 isoform X2 [Folsomia candida]|uniref:uncharacterized protein LOC110853430 isoform X2 n=1 Tax=Folsomia candida TaxID=158441 RepID=UPI001605320E|nr:uncharacterized protein LOC110853430 isoform X2 [Folsomia candida]
MSLYWLFFLSIVILCPNYSHLVYADTVENGNNDNTAKAKDADLVPLVLPNVTFCENTVFRWTLNGLQNYYETVRKFYESVYFTKNISRVHSGIELTVHIRVGISAKSVMATVQVSPYEEMAIGASFEGRLYITARHGNASFMTTRTSKLKDDVMEFKWYLAQTEREEIGRLMEIYTDAVVTHPTRESLILPLRDRLKQAVTLVFKIVRYGISPVFEGRRGLQQCSKEDYN